MPRPAVGAQVADADDTVDETTRPVTVTSAETKCGNGRR